MRKRIPAFFCLCLWVCCLFGCKAKTPSVPRVVSSVTVDWNRDGHSFTRYYTDLQKMEAVLLHLRLAQTEVPPEAVPEAVTNSVYKITVSLIDGTQHHYQQQQHRFFRFEQEPWQSISPERAAQLYTLLRQNKSDI